jgi:hypothetical protein
MVNKRGDYRLVTEWPSGMDAAEVLNFVEAMAAGGAFVRLVVSMMCCVFDSRERRKLKSKGGDVNNEAQGCALNFDTLG